MTDFGASFRKAREASGISLDQIAIETRISTRFLKAIEDEQFHLLPGGIFNRGFVRTYADRIGLDPDQAVSEYEWLTAAREPSDPLANTAIQSKKTGHNLYPVAIGVLVLLIVIYYVVTRESTDTVQTVNQAQVGVSQPENTLPEAAPGPPDIAPDMTSAASTGTPAPAGPEVGTAATPTAPAPVAPPAPTAPAPVAPPAPTAPAPVAPPAPKAPAPATPSTAPAKEAIVAEMEVQETTWIQVVADGTVVAGEILEPGMVRRFAAANSMNVQIGNAAGVTMKLNGTPMKPLGKSGKVREFIITPENLKDVIAKGK